MKKKLIILSLAILGIIGAGILLHPFENSSPPFPLLAREKMKFALSKELVKGGIDLNQSLAWSEDLMAFKGVTDQGVKVIFSEELGASEQIASLQLILKKSKMIADENGEIKVIDLRTLDPYVSIKDN